MSQVLAAIYMVDCRSLYGVQGSFSASCAPLIVIFCYSRMYCPLAPLSNFASQQRKIIEKELSCLLPQNVRRIVPLGLKSTCPLIKTETILIQLCKNDKNKNGSVIIAFNYCAVHINYPHYKSPIFQPDFPSSTP